MLNINILPQKAQLELLEFYQTLVRRYVSGKGKKKNTKSETVFCSKSFFDQYNIDLSGFKFNRGEIYER